MPCSRSRQLWFKGHRDASAIGPHGSVGSSIERTGMAMPTPPASSQQNWTAPILFSFGDVNGIHESATAARRAARRAAGGPWEQTRVATVQNTPDGGAPIARYLDSSLNRLYMVPVPFPLHGLAAGPITSHLILGRLHHARPSAHQHSRKAPRRLRARTHRGGVAINDRDQPARSRQRQPSYRVFRLFSFIASAIASSPSPTRNAPTVGSG